jgi:NAD(P)-dependent dehydrogenase (short-subunit alcohol dehydrogenase family)
MLSEDAGATPGAVVTGPGGSAVAPWGTVLVTGGSSGLGAAVVEAVLRRGGVPVVLDRQPPRPGVSWAQVDLGDTLAAHEAASRVAAGVEHLSGVVTVAGTDSCGRLQDVPLEDWVRVVAVNLLGTAAVIRATLPRLELDEGRVVTVASTLGLKPVSDATAYCASKFGVVGMTRALAIEMAGRVGVTLLIPGGMRTAFFDDRPEQYRPGPDAKLLEPSVVAAAIMSALSQPKGCELRELVVTASTEPSWP